MPPKGSHTMPIIKTIRRLPALALIAAATFATASQAASLSGTVSAENGPLASAMVTLSNVKLGRSVTVYSAADGRFTINADEAGNYDLRVRRLGFNTITETSIEFADNAALTRDVTLKSEPKSLWIHELPASDWYARAQFSTPELRGQFSLQCAMCHQQGSGTTRLPRKKEDWQAIFNMMGDFGAVMTQQLYDEAPDVLNKAYDFANLDLSTFPDQPRVIDPNARDVVITEWDVGHPTAFLHDMIKGNDGLIYSVDWINDKLYALNPTTNMTQEFAIPSGDLPAGGVLGALSDRGRRYMHHSPKLAPHSLQQAPDGKIWITLSIGRGIASFDPKTQKFETFDHPPSVIYPHTVRVDKDSNIWYTVAMSNNLAKFDTKTKTFKIYDLPTRNTTQWIMSHMARAVVWASKTFGLKGHNIVSDPEIVPIPYGIDITPDGKVWFSQFNNRSIGYVDPATDEIKTVETPFIAPRRFRSNSKGQLWIPSYNEGRFYRYTPETNEFKGYDMPTGKGDMAYALAIDARDDSVWLCGTNSDSIIHFDPATEKFVVYQLPTRVSFMRDLEVDTAGNVWTSISNLPFYQVEGQRGKIVRLSFPQNSATTN